MDALNARNTRRIMAGLELSKQYQFCFSAHIPVATIGRKALCLWSWPREALVYLPNAHPFRPSLFFTPTARSRRYLPRRMSQKPSCLSASLIKHSVSMSFFRTNRCHLFLLCIPLICHNPPYYLFLIK